MRPQTVRVPGNVLLIGEYAVLEEGGLGIAIAPDLRVRATRTPGVPPQVTGFYPGGGDAWRPSPHAGARTPEPAQAGGLLSAVVEHLMVWAASNGRSDLPDALGSILVDSSALFDVNGRKQGLGSSAAVTTALTALVAGNGTPAETMLSAAVDAHRHAQAGRGSGYDVASSLYGGTILFSGGAAPQAQRLELPWLGRIALFDGPHTVRTTTAVGAYLRWTERKPAEAREFVKRSNELVRAFAAQAPESPERAAAILKDYRQLGEDLGRRIGVPAEIPTPPLSSGGWFGFKAVGAGCELGVAVEDARVSGSAPAGLRCTPVSTEGVRWE